MKITILCSDARHPIFSRLQAWQSEMSRTHQVNLLTEVSEIVDGDILFLISCSTIIKKPLRDRFKATLVIHASDVPKGRGFAPHIWQILEGKTDLVVTLMEAEDAVDSGRIWQQMPLHINKSDLWYEINEKLFSIELDLMNFAVNNFSSIVPREQPNVVPTFYKRRKPSDGQLDPSASISSQFDLLRVADPDRFPCFFEWEGRKYKLLLSSFNDDDLN